MQLNSASIFLLSPHADDIALSLGGWLAVVQDSYPELLKKMEVFTGFIWSSALPHISELAGDAVKATQLRKQEEQQFCDSFGLSLSFGALPDTSILNIDYLEPVDLNKDQRMTMLRETLVERVANKIVFAPVSLGDHIDHRICWRIASELSADSEMVVFYEDLPYATWYQDEERENIIKDKLGEQAIPFVCELGADKRATKQKNLSHYRSQLNETEIAGVMDYRITDPQRSLEVVWVVEPTQQQIVLLAEMGFQAMDETEYLTKVSSNESAVQ